MSWEDEKDNEPPWRKAPAPGKLPLEELLNADDRKENRTDKVTRKVAIVVVFVAVFYFFIKLLFL